jgi:hypothetical protein
VDFIDTDRPHQTDTPHVVPAGFGDVYATGPDVQLGTGALWAFTRDMQIDLGTYLGVHGREPVATPFLGFSIRR